MEVIQEYQIFEKAYEHVKKWEGGYVNDKYDKGGETRFGISKRAYPEIDIASLTEDEAKRIYYVDYWKALKLEYLNSELITIELFDFGVNAGIRTATKALQRSLALMDYPVEVDGIIGGGTISAANAAIVNYEKALLNAIRGYEFLHYKNIVLKNPSQKRFIKGWLARI